MNVAEQRSDSLFPAQMACLEPGTCSARATQYFLSKHRADGVGINQWGSFAEAVESLRMCEDPGEFLLLPHLHELVGVLTVSAEFQLRSDLAFWLPNPPLFLARGSLQDGRCASLPTLRGLVPEGEFEFVEVGNTQEAARAVRDGECEFCLTNASGLMRYSLLWVRQLKQVTVCWLPFRYYKPTG